ncbi:MAG TPA: hypothetical protein VE621_12885 [Bryobacteraceae bacterium]|nr:hypothetical protein [Bryobacteraceae bacterium]
MTFTPPPAQKDQPEGKLEEYIQYLEQSSAANPASADLLTCLGIAHTVRGNVYQAFKSLQRAVAIDANHFFARLRYAELLFRLRSFQNAERECRKALMLARTKVEWRMAHEQLKQIRSSIEGAGAAVSLAIPQAAMPDSPFFICLALLALYLTLLSKV